MNKKSWNLLALLLAVIVISACSFAGCGGPTEVDFDILLSSEALQMDALERAELVATITDTDGNPVEKTVTWTSDNESVAAVENGVVTATDAGTAVITAEADGKTPQCTVTVSAVIRPVMVLSKTEFEIGKNTTAQILPTIRFKSNTLDEAAYGITYSFTSSDANRVTVNEKGVITGVGVGTAEITVKANFPLAIAAGLDSELTAVISVAIAPNYTLSIDLVDDFTTDVYLQEAVAGDVIYLASTKLTVVEGRYDDKDIKADVVWCSSDETIAVVSADGVVTLAAGAQEGDTVDIWAKYVTDGEGEANSNRFTITVYKAIVEKTPASELIVDLGAGGKLDAAVIDLNFTIVDVYDSEDEFKTSLWDSKNSCIKADSVTHLGNRTLIIVGDKINYEVEALVISKVIKTAQDFAEIFFSNSNIAAIKADGYYILGNNIDVSGINYVG